MMFFSYNPALDSTILFLHPDADKEKFLSNFMVKNNYLNTDVVQVFFLSVSGRAGCMLLST
jgi:hypothetical protein